MSDSELKGLVEHVQCEVRMLDRCCLWIERKWNQNEAEVQNAFLESWVVHLRNLADFLWKKSRETDLSAKDFVGNWRPYHVPHDPTEEYRNNINRLVTHVSKERPKRKKEQWPIRDLTRKILKAFKEFAEREHRGWFLDIDCSSLRLDGPAGPVTSSVLTGEKVSRFAGLTKRRQ